MQAWNPFRKLTGFEWGLWLFSLAVVTLSFLFGGGHPLTLAASLIGVTALIFVAKGEVLGQILTVVFSLAYAAVSLRFRYYGEMITYLCMTAPMAALAVFTWLKHPSDAGAHEVEAAKLTKTRAVIMIVFTVIVTGAFWSILGWLGTANLVVSTVSVATSFIASYLTWCRSPYYAIAYAANDIVLIILWTYAAMSDISCLAMTGCFAAFLANDIYGFISWNRRMAAQESARAARSV